MAKTDEELYAWLKEQKLPYTKKLDNGLYEVFDGQRITFMGERLYEKFQAMMLDYGTKGLNKIP